MGLRGLTRFLLSGLILGFCNCKAVYYTPFLHQAPLLREEGEFIYSGGFSGTEDKTYLLENNFAFAVNERIAVTATNSLLMTPVNVGLNVSAGAGYFKPVNAQQNLIFETYAGLGYHVLLNDLGTSNFYRFFVQPDFGFRHENIEFALAPRLVSMYASPSGKIQDFNHDQTYYQYNGVRKGMYYFFEPGFIYRIGSPRLKLHVQVAHATPLTTKPIIYDRLSFNFGLTVRN